MTEEAGFTNEEERLIAESVQKFEINQRRRQDRKNNADRVIRQKVDRVEAIQPSPELSRSQAKKLVVEELKKRPSPTQKERICAALAKGDSAVDEIVKAIVTVVGVAMITNTAITASLSPSTLISGAALLAFKMGTAYFCTESSSS